MGTPQDARLVIYPALIVILVGDPPLGTMLAAAATPFTGPGIYHAEAPQGALRPYLIVGEATEVPFNTMGPASSPKWGSDCSVMVKAVVQGSSDLPALAILNRVKALLEGTPLNVFGFGSAWCEFETAVPGNKELVGGIVVRHLPAIYRVRVHESVA